VKYAVRGQHAALTELYNVVRSLVDNSKDLASRLHWLYTSDILQNWTQTAFYILPLFTCKNFHTQSEAGDTVCYSTVLSGWLCVLQHSVKRMTLCVTAQCQADDTVCYSTVSSGWHCVLKHSVKRMTLCVTAQCQAVFRIWPATCLDLSLTKVSETGTIKLFQHDAVALHYFSCLIVSHIENYIVRNLMICTPHPILFGW
jgi:hypothetical protein